jgi:hypothetical protein
MRFILGLFGGGLATLLLAVAFDFPAGLLPTNEVETAPEQPVAVIAQDVEDQSELETQPADKPVAMTPMQIEPISEPPPEPFDDPHPAAGAEMDVVTIAAVHPEQQDDPLSEPDDLLPPDTLTAVAWKPFHSEVSASGFARRLSTQLGYPFHSIRKGPARYYVVFDYATEAQRLLLHQQVATLTGYAGQ